MFSKPDAYKNINTSSTINIETINSEDIMLIRQKIEAALYNLPTNTFPKVKWIWTRLDDILSSDYIIITRIKITNGYDTFISMLKTI